MWISYKYHEISRKLYHKSLWKSIHFIHKIIFSLKLYQLPFLIEHLISILPQF